MPTTKHELLDWLMDVPEDAEIGTSIASAPIELKADNPIRHAEEDPAFTLGCITCQKQIKSNWIRLQFVQGQEENWETDAQAAVDKHIQSFHHE